MLKRHQETGLARQDKIPSNSQAEEAIRTLLKWLGEDPKREGLVDTPARVLRGLKEQCQGSKQDHASLMQSTFCESEGYGELVVLHDIRFFSLCEHHLAPIVGRASVGYVPDKKVVGLSKLARVVDVFARRLQMQERLTMQIAQAIQDTLAPKGVAVHIEAEHFCLAARGAHKPGAIMTTSHGTGILAAGKEGRRSFDEQLRRNRARSGT